MKTPKPSPITPGIVDLGLFATTTSYAIWLWAFRKRPAPHTTWVKVVVGDTMVLAAAALRFRVGGGDYERGLWWSFVVGGAPIIIGELAQSLERKTELRELEDGDAHPTPPGWE